MHVLCGVSGGADSMALLHMLAERRDKGEMVLTAAHFEHGIRGADSRADRNFVMAVCERLGVPVIVESADVPRMAKARRIGLEQAARDARHAFFRRAKDACGADVIALAHHCGDQAETVLMHIARGSGLKGAAAMARRKGDIWRPLLEKSKDELIAYLAERGEGYREDATNWVSDNPRNAIRNELMPRLTAIYPGAEAALCRFAQIARAEDQYMTEVVDGMFAAHVKRMPMGLSIAHVEGMPLALLRRLLARAVPGIGFDMVERLVALYQDKRGRISIGGRMVVERAGSHLYVINEVVVPPNAVPLEKETVLAGLGCMLVSDCDPKKPLFVTDSAQPLNAEAVKGAVLRCRKDGDRFRMLGSSGHRLLSDVMIDRHIDRPLRDFWPLMAVGDEVIWAPGIGVNECAKITPDTEQAVLAMWLEKDLNTEDE